MKFAAIVALTAVALSAASCGQDRLTKAEYIEQADAICKDLNEETASLQQPQSKEEFEEFARHAVRKTKEAVSELRDLNPPREDEDLIRRWLEKTEQAVELLPEMQEALEENDLDRVNELGTQIQAAAGEVRRIAEEYGFKRCGRGGVTPAE